MGFHVNLGEGKYWGSRIFGNCADDLSFGPRMLPQLVHQEAQGLTSNPQAHMYIHIYICTNINTYCIFTYTMYVCMYIYIVVEEGEKRGRERQKERSIYIYVYIYMYIYTPKGTLMMSTFPQNRSYLGVSICWGCQFWLFL